MTDLVGRLLVRRFDVDVVGRQQVLARLGLGAGHGTGQRDVAVQVAHQVLGHPGQKKNKQTNNGIRKKLRSGQHKMKRIKLDDPFEIGQEPYRRNFMESEDLLIR